MDSSFDSDEDLAASNKAAAKEEESSGSEEEALAKPVKIPVKPQADAKKTPVSAIKKTHVAARKKAPVSAAKKEELNTSDLSDSEEEAPAKPVKTPVKTQADAKKTPVSAIKKAPVAGRKKVPVFAAKKEESNTSDLSDSEEEASAKPVKTPVNTQAHAKKTPVSAIKKAPVAARKKALVSAAKKDESNTSDLSDSEEKAPAKPVKTPVKPLAVANKAPVSAAKKAKWLKAKAPAKPAKIPVTSLGNLTATTPALAEAVKRKAVSPEPMNPVKRHREQAVAPSASIATKRIASGSIAHRVVFLGLDVDSVTTQDLETCTGGTDGIIIYSMRMGLVTLPSTEGVTALTRNGSITINGCTMALVADSHNKAGVPKSEAVKREAVSPEPMTPVKKYRAQDKECRIALLSYFDVESVTARDLESATGGSKATIFQRLGFVTLPSAVHAKALVEKGSITVNGCKFGVRPYMAKSKLKRTILVTNLDVESVTSQDLESATGGSNANIIHSERLGFVTLPSPADANALVEKGSVTVNGCTFGVRPYLSKAAEAECKIVVMNLDVESVTSLDLKSATEGSNADILHSERIGFVTLPSAADAKALLEEGSITVNGCTFGVRPYNSLSGEAN